MFLAGATGSRRAPCFVPFARTAHQPRRVVGAPCATAAAFGSGCDGGGTLPRLQSGLQRKRPQKETGRTLISASASSPRSREECFVADVTRHLPRDGRMVALSTAWRVTDNVLLALLSVHFPSIFAGLRLVAVDTLHLFPETLACAQRVQEKYGKQAQWVRPRSADTAAEFAARYGDARTMDASEFFFLSRVEPLQRALRGCGEVAALVTGRRGDQDAQRIDLPVWEETRRTFNPLVDWHWPEVVAYANAHEVPVNRAHHYVFRSDTPIGAANRRLPRLPWAKVDLGKPFWRATEAEILGSPPASVAYVFKHIGDAHTTVPVELYKGERADRFVQC